MTPRLTQGRIFVLVFLAFLLSACLKPAEAPVVEDQPEIPADARGEVVRDVELTEDFVGVDPALVERGCESGLDCIPSIDAPTFIPASEATWLSPDERVMGMTLNGVTRAYPVQILSVFELVNDWLGDQPVLLTYCSLCGSFYAFDREVDGVITQFGASGELQHTCMIMYDRYQGNRWQQMTGAAISGEAAQRGDSLNRLPVVVTTWEDWLATHPDTEVLDRPEDTPRDFAVSYQRYQDYASSDLFFSPAERMFEASDRFDSASEKSTQLGLKDIVYGLIVEGETAAISEKRLIEEGTMRLTLAGRDLNVTRQTNGQLSVFDTVTAQPVVPQRAFWFAWHAYFPDSLVIE